MSFCNNDFVLTFRSPDVPVRRQSYQGSTETNVKYNLWYRLESNGEQKSNTAILISNNFHGKSEMLNFHKINKIRSEASLCFNRFRTKFENLCKLSFTCTWIIFINLHLHMIRNDFFCIFNISDPGKSHCDRNFNLFYLSFPNARPCRKI